MLDAVATLVRVSFIAEFELQATQWASKLLPPELLSLVEELPAYTLLILFLRAKCFSQLCTLVL